MTDEIAGGEAPVIETTTTAPEAVVSSLEPVNQVQERNFEDEARDMGWVPETDFRGPKERWKDAKTFVEDGENILPIVRAENKRLKDKLDAQEKDHAARFERLDKATKVTLKVAKEQFDRRLAELTTQREAAVEAGDISTFRKLDQQIDAHEKTAPDLDGLEEKAPTSDDNDAVMASWQQDNAWYQTDDTLTEAAIGISQNILRKNPNISLAENLKQTDAELRKRFPLKFGASGANGHAPVDGGGEPKGPTRSASPLFDKLPAEAKAMAKQAVADKIYKSVEDWAKVYNE